MALRLFKKKDGSPSGFAKIVKGATKVASFLPIPFAGKAGDVIGKLTDKVSGLKEKTGVNISAVVPQAGENIGAFVNRLQAGVGGAVAGFQSSGIDAVSTTSPLKPIEQGYVKEKSKNYIYMGVAALGLIIILKKTKII